MSCVIDTTTTLITAPTVSPIDVSYAKDHLKSLVDDDDVLIQSWIAAAAQYFEEQTNRQIMQATWEYWLDAFPVERKIELPHPPLMSVLSVKYVSSDGSILDFTGGSPEAPLWQTKAPTGPHARRGWIEPIEGQSWPTAREESGAVRIQFLAGYGDTTGDVPDLIKAALLLLVGQLDRYRSEISDGASLQQLPLGLDQMISGFKYTAYPSQVLHQSWP